MNEYNNKVVTSDGTTLIDLTEDTVTEPSHIMEGYYGHLASGERVLGTGRGGGDYYITYGDNTVDFAEVGTAVTDEPNYTPTGEVKLTSKDVSVVTGASLSWAVNNNRLVISGITTNTGTISVPTSAEFVGNGVTFEIKEIVK